MAFTFAAVAVSASPANYDINVILSLTGSGAFLGAGGGPLG